MASIGAASSVVVGRTPQIAVLAQAVLGVGIEERVPPVGLEQPLDIAELFLSMRGSSRALW